MRYIYNNIKLRMVDVNDGGGKRDTGKENNKPTSNAALPTCNYGEKVTARNKYNAAKKIYDDDVLLKAGYEATKDEYDSFIPLLKSFMDILKNYENALRYVGQCLRYVIVNDLPFDKSQCTKMADDVKSYRKTLKEIKEECETNKENLVTKINEITGRLDAEESAKDTAKNAMEAIGVCPRCGVMH